MVTARGRRELERTASWSAVRSGLSWLIGAWLVLTFASVGVQLQNMQIAPAIAAKDPAALVVMTIVSAGYQLFYVLVSLVLVVALARVTRVPPSTRAVTPAVVAMFSFVLVGLASSVLLLGMGARSSEAISTRELWVLAAVARAAGLFALGLTLTRMAAALGARLPPAEVGASFAFVLIDTAFPLHRLLTSATGPQPTALRTALLAVQIALALLLVDLARRVRSAAAGAPVESAPPAELEAPEPEVSEPDHRPPRATGAGTGSRNAAALLVFAMIALFPAWDALLTSTSVGALSAAVRGATGTQAPTVALWFAAGALGTALILRQLMASSPYGARAVFLLAALAVLAYAVPRTYEQARYRSSLVDAWPVCETGLDHDGNLPSADDVYRGVYDGPRLPEGEPCTRVAERRDQHEALAPRGDFSDGIVQIASRFPDDRRRVLWGWGALSLIAVAAGLLVFRAAGPPDEPASETPVERGDTPETASLPEESPRDSGEA
ncbi:MAG: hypothetical protein HYZ29_25595 [Myxococcales bacterium]|nr:hypothetical protein [Myxococcales bacterium]